MSKPRHLSLKEAIEREAFVLATQLDRTIAGSVALIVLLGWADVQERRDIHKRLRAEVAKRLKNLNDDSDRVKQELTEA